MVNNKIQEIKVKIQADKKNMLKKIFKYKF